MPLGPFWGRFGDSSSTPSTAPHTGGGLFGWFWRFLAPGSSAGSNNGGQGLNNFFWRYFAPGGAYIPPVQPPVSSGSGGLRSFNPCSPCCEEDDGDIWCSPDIVGYTGHMAVINGGGVYPLYYSGLNELGFPCWRGIVNFSRGIAGTIKSNMPTGTAYTLADQGITNPIVVGNGYIPNGTQDYCGSFPSGYVFANDLWNNSNNLVPSCNIRTSAVPNPLTDCGDPNRSFYLCSKIFNVDCTVNFPDVEYEYYRRPDKVWKVRFRYSSLDVFENANSINESLNSSSNILLSATDSISVCNFHFLFGKAITSLTEAGIEWTGFFLGTGIKSQSFLGGHDQQSWNWIRPVYSNDKFSEVTDGVHNSITVDSLAYSPVHYYYGQVFVGVTTNTPDLELDYGSFGFSNYYSDAFDPKFAKTITHPYFCTSYIENTASLYHSGVNSRSFYQQESYMFANGYFRAIVPYPLKRTINLVFTGRPKKLSPRLNCLIDFGGSYVNCELNAVKYDKDVGGFQSAKYCGQPDKYSFVYLFIDLQGRVSFGYHKLNPGETLYNKVRCNFFKDLNSVSEYKCFAHNCTDPTVCCVDYSTWSTTKCDARLGDDLSETVPQRLFKVYQTLLYSLQSSNISNLDPLILNFSARSTNKVSMTRGVVINNYNGGYPADSFPCNEVVPFAEQQNITNCGDYGDAPMEVTYDYANVLITELT